MNFAARQATMRRMAVLGRRWVSGAPVGVSHGVPNAKAAFNKSLPVRFTDLMAECFNDSWRIFTNILEYP